MAVASLVWCLTSFIYISTTIAGTTNIPNEEVACIAIARAFPQLQSLTGTHLLHVHCVPHKLTNATFLTPNMPFLITGLYAGKTGWSTSPPAWSGSLTTQPSCCSNQGVTCGQVSGSSSYASILTVDFGGLGLTGSLPSEIGFLNGMTNFSIGSNLIHGSIPSTVGDMTALRYLDMGLNLLTGAIPSSIGDLTSLDVLLLLQNSLTGTIPESIGSLQSLTVLFADTNSLSGTIPETIGSLSLLKVLSLYTNHLAGTIPSSVGALTSLEIMYLDNNSLTGTIPATLSSLTAMHTLVLELNYLTMGSATTVPTTTFSQFTQDNSLDISKNCLVYTSVLNPSQSTTATRCKCKSCEVEYSTIA